MTPNRGDRLDRGPVVLVLLLVLALDLLWFGGQIDYEHEHEHEHDPEEHGRPHDLGSYSGK